MQRSTREILTMRCSFILITLATLLALSEVLANIYEDQNFFVMQKKDAMFYDSPGAAFAVETSDTTDGADDFTIFCDKKLKKSYIYSELTYKYTVIDCNYDDCDKTEFANKLLKDLADYKYKTNSNLITQPNQNAYDARVYTTTYRNNFGVTAYTINQKYP